MTDEPNAASVAIVSVGKVLLIKRALPPYQDYWTLPGGRLEAGETTVACALREVEEELGLSLGPIVSLTTQVAGDWQLEVFASPAPDATLVPSDEISDWRWVLPDEISHLKTTPGLSRILQSAVRQLNKV